MKITKIKNFSFIIGLILFGIIVWQSDLKKLLDVAININWWWILLAYLLDFPEVLSKAFAWRLMMKKQDIRYPLKECFFMYMSGMAAGFFTPGKFGEFSRVLYLTKDGHSVGKSLVSVILDRLASLVYLLIAGYIGALILIDSFWVQTYTILVILSVTVIAIIIIFKQGWYKKIFRKIFKFLIPKKYQSRFELNYQDFILGLKKYSIVDYIKYFLITIIPWLIYYFEFYFLARAVGITNIPFMYLSLAITVSFFFVFLPISYLGIGTREIALLLFLSPLGLGRETIIILAELALLDSFWTAGTGLIFWLVRPLPFKFKDNKNYEEFKN